MDIKKIIKDINNLELDARVNKLNDLLDISKYYFSNNLTDNDLAYSLIDCINGIRQSRFIETNEELELIDISLRFARHLNDKTKILSCLRDLYYYADYFPEKYQKDEIEKEIAKIETR